MALQHALIRIDPARYVVVERELLALTANSANELAALYKACDRPLSETVVRAFVQAFSSDHAAQRRFRAVLLGELVAEKTWDLDKSLPYLAEIVAIVPELRTLRPFTQLTGCKLRIHDDCRGDQHGGLAALWSADSLTAYLAPLSRFTQPEIAQELANSASASGYSWRKRTTQRLCRSIDSWTEPYLWVAWEQLCDAIREVTAEDAWLGCSIT